ncbi:signal peptidase I [Paenibacillus sp. Dod16]|uniref:signal peptidase I n=1 Tax=Paenibacillus sp. Dod16 TaxID=3416392 RepID=UPI003CF63EC4
MKIKLLLLMVLILSITGCTTNKNTLENINVSEKPKVLKFIDYKIDNMSRTRSEYHFIEDGSLVVDTVIDNKTLKPGDIVYFQPPEFEGFPGNPDFKLADYNISRVIANPGDSIEIKKGKILVNNKKLDYFFGEVSKYGFTKNVYIEKEKEDNPNFELSQEEMDFFNQSIPKMKIPKNHIFVIGDNWGRSVDSRHFGPVPYENIQGKVLGVTKEAK